MLAPTEVVIKNRLQARFLGPARMRLGPEWWDRVRRGGAAMNLPDAIAFAVR